MKGNSFACNDSRVEQEEDWLFFFPVKDLANEKPWYFCLLQLSGLPGPPYNRVLLSWPCGDLHDAQVG